MPICITGMHRSGTSVLALMLRRCGVYLGEPDELYGAATDNPSGHWEHKAIVSINDRLLATLGGAWDVPPPLPAGWHTAESLAPLRSEARDIVSRLGRAPLWGFKDPRVSLLLPFWRELIPDGHWIVCVRDPREVAASLAARGSYSSQAFGQGLWRSYNAAILRDSTAAERLVVSYETLYSDPAGTLASILVALRIVVPGAVLREALNAFEPGLRKSLVSPQHGDFVSPDVEHMHAALAGEAAELIAAAHRGPATANERLLQLHVADLAAEIEARQAALDRTTAALSQTQSALDQAGAAIARESERAAAHAAETAHMRAENLELRQAADDARAREQRLAGALEHAQHERDALRDALEAAQERQRAHQADADGLRALLETAERARADFAAAEAHLQSEVQRLGSALGSASDLLAQAQAAAAAGDAERRELVERLQGQAEESSRLATRLAQIGQAVSWLRLSRVMDVPRWYWRLRLALRGGDAHLRTIPAAQLLLGKPEALLSAPPQPREPLPSRATPQAGVVQGLRQQLQNLSGLVMGNLDMPQEGARVAGSVHVHGWAYSRAVAIERVDVTLDGAPAVAAQSGLQRPDVKAVHPEFGAGADACGFDASIELPGVEQDTPRRLVVRAVDAAGNHIEFERGFVQCAPATGEPSRRALRHMAQTSRAGASEYSLPTDDGFAPPSSDLKLIAFYLPQFHPIPENDAWWGKGFTEWANVTRAVPQFVGHYQPHLPGELGFYDLRLIDVQRRQIELARQYGIHGFCYHYYWFSGKKLLERPLQQLLANPDLDFPFCLCWANENWTRRWDGLHDDILIAQKHLPEDDEDFIRDIEPALRDPRYIRINGRPLLIVYRPSQLVNAKRTASTWRAHCQRAGLGNPYLVMAQTFGDADPRPYGFDAAVEFPPHNVMWQSINAELEFLNANYEGTVIDYAAVVASAEASKEAPYRVFRTVFPGWDNEARKPGRGYVFARSTPVLYRRWLDSAIRRTDARADEADRLVFINAWNEWAEGAHLEPDRKFGYAYLQATADALLLRDLAPRGNVIAPEGGRRRRSDMAVVAHVYYHDLWDEIAERLDALGAAFDLYVSLPLNKLVSPMVARIRKRYPGATIYLAENRGRDMAPFLRVLADIADLGYTAVCKVHTKRSTHREDGDEWRRDALDGLLSPAHVALILDALRRGDAGVVGPAGHLVDGRYYSGLNELTVAELAGRLGHDARKDAPAFVSGSMFWFRPEALRPLLSLGLTLDHFEPEQGQTDGTLAHALERLVPIAARIAGFATIDAASLNGRMNGNGKTTGAYRFAQRTR